MLDDPTSRMDLSPDPQGDVDARLVPLTRHEVQLLILGVSRVSQQAEDQGAQCLPLRDLFHYAWRGEALPAEFAARLEAAVQDVWAAREQRRPPSDDFAGVQDRHNAGWQRAWRGRQHEEVED